MADRLRAAGLTPRRAADAFAVTAGPVLLRLSLGRWPDAAEQAGFRTAFADRNATFPALVRGLTAVPDVCTMLGHALRQDNPPSPLAGSVLNAWTGPKLAFMHLEKCGGIAVMLWLTPQFHPDQIDPDPFRAVSPHQFYRGVAGLGRDITRYPLLWGHFGLPPLERIDPGRFVFTFLREPRDRLISIYHFWRSIRPERVDAIDQDPIIGSAHRNDLLGFLRDTEPSLRDHIDNFYTRRLTDRYATGFAVDPLAADPQAGLGEAMAALDRIGFVGISERMDESVSRLAAMTGAAPPETAIRGNVSADNPVESAHFFRPVERSAITPAIEAELDRVTSLDRVIYAAALARFGRADPVAPHA